MKISTQMKELAILAGYDVAVLKNLKALRKAWAVRTLSSSYCDQYDAQLGEALGLRLLDGPALHKVAYWD